MITGLASRVSDFPGTVVLRRSNGRIAVAVRRRNRGTRRSNEHSDSSGARFNSCRNSHRRPPKTFVGVRSANLCTRRGTTVGLRPTGIAPSNTNRESPQTVIHYAIVSFPVFRPGGHCDSGATNSRFATETASPQQGSKDPRFRKSAPHTATGPLQPPRPTMPPNVAKPKPQANLAHRSKEPPHALRQQAAASPDGGPVSPNPQSLARA